MGRFVRVASLADLEAAGRLVVTLDGRPVCLFLDAGRVFAVDNRCPHMGFPLHRGSVHDGILTCHWHHARFDLTGGGTFDQFADDLRCYPAEARDGEVWVDGAPRGDPLAHQRRRLRDGLEHGVSLVVAKSAVFLLDAGEDPVEPFRIGLDFGTTYRQAGWGPGLTMLTCLTNLLPHLDPQDRPRALYHGLSAVARETAGEPPRFLVGPLPGSEADPATLARWFRRFVEVRDAEGAERCIASAVRAGTDRQAIAGMLFAAATDHRYLDAGHAADFSNKALEALDLAGWEHAEQVLTSLAPMYADAARMEESSEWRHPVDLVAILESAFGEMPAALRAGRQRRGSWQGRKELVSVLLGEDPQAISGALLAALREGATEDRLAAAVAYSAALRIARFHTANEFSDWDTALHTFSFANAVHQGLRRSPSPEVLRGVFDAAMSIYLDRFLNVPPARLPEPGEPDDPQAFLAELPALLDRQQQVNQAGSLVARYLGSGGEAGRLVAALGRMLLREDRDFHTIQTVEAAVRQSGQAGAGAEGAHLMVAAARYLAAHAPTMRAQGQTFQIAERLHRGEKLYEED